MARPSEFTEDIAAKICALIADGQSLRKICLDEEFPDKSTVFRWLGTNTKFRDQYARAREEQADNYFEQILEIADDDKGDYGFKEASDKDGEGAKPCILPDNINRARLRVDSRKWVVSKLAPKKYGDFNRTELTGADGGAISLSIADQIRKAHEEA